MYIQIIYTTIFFIHGADVKLFALKGDACFSESIGTPFRSTITNCRLNFYCVVRGICACNTYNNGVVSTHLSYTEGEEHD